MFNLFNIFFNPSWLCENVFTLYGGGKGDAPDPPDYAAAAAATAKGNLDAARASATANRVNQITPYGNLNYAITGKDNYGNDVWTATQSLAPAQQKLLDQQNKISLGLGDTMNQGLGYVQNILDNPFDTSKLPAEQINAGQTVQDAIMSRLNPQFDRLQNQTDTKLANQGIAQGTEAYKNAQMDLSNQRNDAYTQAALQGMNTGQQARQQALQEQAYLRNEPLNTLNAVRTGAQVTSPTFVNPAQQSTTQGADLLGAAQSSYNAQLGNYNARQAGGNALMGGLFSLGSAGIGAYPWGR